jgi:CheY-like chemotaxis protein
MKADYRLTQKKDSKPRLLLAEENSINRKVAVQVLRNLGYDVDAVANGKEALDHFRRSRYAIVILDCQTTEMDGYEAAKAIRQLEGTSGRTPIIALTAHTMQSDRKKREEAGMDDYISLPINPRIVVTVLARWDTAATAPRGARLTSVDKSVIDELKGLSREDNPTLLDELVELFIGGSPRRIAELRSAISRKDHEGLARAAHNLKSSSAQMGALRMQEISAALETLGRTGAMTGTETLVEELAAEFDRVIPDLQSMAHEADDSEAEPTQADEDEVDPVTFDSPGFDLAVVAAGFQGKRFLALDVFPALLSKLQSALIAIGCPIVSIAESDLNDLKRPSRGDLLLLGARAAKTGALEKYLALSQPPLPIPVIVVAAVVDSALLQFTEEWDADFVLEPFRVGDILLRAYQRLTSKGLSAPGPSSGQSRELLVTEDDPLIARFLVSTLTSAGFQVTHVLDGDAALSVLNQKTFELVILDINMPKTDGYGVLSKLRLMPEYKSKPVLMLSARTQEHDIVRAFELGADDYVTKPFNPLEVVSRVRRLLKRR